MTERTNILILADRDAKTLWPLTEIAPPPLLPIGGKPLLGHLLDVLSTCVVANVTVVVAIGDKRTPAWLAERGYPRLNIKVTDQGSPVADTEKLVFRGDIVTYPDEIRRFVEETQASETPSPSNPAHGAWRLRAGELTATWRHAAMLADHADRMLPTIAAYWRMNLAAARRELDGLPLAGWVGEDGLRLGVNARVLTRRATGKNILVGDAAFVDRLVALGDNVVIGDGCVIAKGAMLSNAVVLPGSYVGPGIDINNAVVAGGWLWRAEDDRIVKVEDKTILGRLAA